MLSLGVTDREVAALLSATRRKIDIARISHGSGPEKNANGVAAIRRSRR
jgi:hypothetical protein